MARRAHLAGLRQADARLLGLHHLVGDLQRGALGLLQVLDQRDVLQDVALRRTRSGVSEHQTIMRWYFHENWS